MVKELKAREYKRFEDIKKVRGDGADTLLKTIFLRSGKSLMARLKAKAKAGKLMLDE